MPAAIAAGAATAVLGAAGAVKAVDAWQETRKQAWLEQARAALEAGSEELPPLPFGVSLAADADAMDGEQDDAAARALSQLLLFGARTPEYQAELMRIAQQENAKAAAIAAADPTTIPNVASTVLANSIGPMGARIEYNGSYYPGNDSGRVRAIRVHPLDPNTVFVATTGGGVWKTSNFHTSSPTWVPLTDNVIASIDLGGMDIDPTGNMIVVGTGEHGDALPGGSIMKSTDGGNTWQTPVLLTGTNTGATFTVTAAQVRSVVIDPNNTNVVMAATDVGVFRSTDGASSFTLIDLPNPAAYTPAVTGATSDLEGAYDIVYLGNVGGVSQWMVSGDYACPGASPPLRNNHVPNCQAATGIATNPTTGTLGDIWKSTDDGATWTSMRMANKLPTQAATWGATGSDSQGLLDVGRMGIASAPNADPNLASVYVEAASVNDSAATTMTVLLFNTRDGGNTWNKLATPKSTNLTNPTSGPACNTVNPGHAQGWYNIAIAVDPGNPDRAIVGGNLCGLRTVDGGATWQNISHWLPSSGSGTAVTAGTNPPNIEGPLPYVHADWHTATVSRVGGKYVTMVGCDGGLFSSYDVFDKPIGSLVTWAQPNQGLVTMLPYGHGTGDPVLGNANTVWIGLQDNGTRFRLSQTENVFINTLQNWDQVQGGDGTGNALASDGNGQNQVYWAGLPTGPRTFCRPAARDCSRATTVFDGNESSNWSRFGIPTAVRLAGDSDPFTIRYSPTYDPQSSVITAGNFAAYKITVNANDQATAVLMTPNGFGGGNVQSQMIAASPWTYQINGKTTHVYGAVLTGGRFFIITDDGSGTFGGTRTANQLGDGTNRLTGSSSIAFPRNPSNFGGTSPTSTFIVSSAATIVSNTGLPIPASLGHLFKTSDGGTTWTPIHGNGTPAPSGTGTLDLPNIPIYVVRIDYGDPTEQTIYVGTELGMYRTVDGGNTWARYGKIPTARIVDLSVSLNGSLVRASAYGRGVWEIYPHSEVGGAIGDGDYDKNGVIDFRDLIATAANIGKTPAMNVNDPNSYPAFYVEPRYDAALDIPDANGNVDGKVDDTDLTAVLTKFGGTP